MTAGMCVCVGGWMIYFTGQIFALDYVVLVTHQFSSSHGESNQRERYIFYKMYHGIFRKYLTTLTPPTT